jgi:hypothetical protein
MNEPWQANLFISPVKRVETPPHVSQSDTSRRAAQAVAPVAGTLRARVLARIQEEACTDEEGCASTGMNPSTWRPRRVELLEAGLIVRVGVRPGVSGRLMAVWAAA